jgi:carboxylate-amine ligase
MRREIIRAARSIDKQIAAAGTHPFAQWQDQQLSPKARYRAQQKSYWQLACEQTIFACHIHVGIDNRHEALQVMNHTRGWLALLLALTGNSPFFQSTDTGYASYRTEVWARWPLCGAPAYFSSLTEYDNLINDLTVSGTIADAREIYWDMRLSSRFNTIEVRVTDVALTIEETTMIAGLVRALIQTCHELVLQNQPFPAIRQEILRAAHWQAARYGLDAHLIEPCTGQVLPARQLLAQFLQFVHPALDAQGDWEIVSNAVKAILERGTGAMRQREAYRQTGRLQAVVDFVVKETAAGLLQSA